MPLDQRVGNRLKLRDLRILMEVISAGSMNKAADRLHVSQPVISKAIASLERTLGVRLLDRNVHGVNLTEYGRATLRCGVAVFDSIKKGFEEIEFITDPTVGVVRVGCTEPAFASIGTAVIDLLSPRYPRMVFELTRVDRTAPYRDLEARNVDFVIVDLIRPFTEDHMAAEILYTDSAVVAVGLQSPWARRRHVDLAELVDEPWLLSEPESYVSSIVAAAFRARGLRPPQPAVIASSNMRVALLASGRFVTAIPNAILQMSGMRGLIKALPITLPGQPRGVAIVTLKDRSLSPVAQLFMQCARDVGNRLMDGRTNGGRSSRRKTSISGTTAKSRPAKG